MITYIVENRYHKQDTPARRRPMMVSPPSSSDPPAGRRRKPAEPPHLDDRVRGVLEQCDRSLPFGVVYVPAADDEAVPGKLFTPFCARCVTRECAGQCRPVILGSAQQAALIGEPYYSVCWIGLNMVAFPIVHRGSVVGAIETGGFLFPETQESTRRIVGDALQRFSADARQALQHGLAELQVVSAAEIRGYSTFIHDALFAAGLNRPGEFAALHDRDLQQRRIA